MRRFTVKGAGIIAIAAASVLSTSVPPALARADADNAFSRANTLLFLTDHLDNVQAPALLHYAFDRRGSMEAPFHDVINISLSRGESREKNVKFKYFSGARSQYIPPISGAEGNPVISLFLQRDVSDMEQHTGGSALYFQKLIKLAFENDAEVKPVHFDYDGHVVAGTKIKVTPYVHDPHRNELRQYVGKYYSFTLSKAVPGQVYEMRTVVPEKAGQTSRTDTKALLEEVLTLAAVEPLSSNPQPEVTN